MPRGTCNCCWQSTHQFVSTCTRNAANTINKTSPPGEVHQADHAYTKGHTECHVLVHVCKDYKYMYGHTCKRRSQSLGQRWDERSHALCHPVPPNPSPDKNKSKENDIIRHADPLSIAQRRRYEEQMQITQSLEPAPTSSINKTVLVFLYGPTPKTACKRGRSISDKFDFATSYLAS